MTNRSIETEEYRFNEAQHLHELKVGEDWKALTGCTTILGVLAKPALIQWSANMAVDFIDSEYKRVTNVDTWNYRKSLEENWANILKEAKVAHRKKKETAGTWGTEVHAEIERFILNTMANKMPTPMYEDRINHFITWATENKVKFLEAEKSVYSKSLFLGGIVDIICEIDGEMWLADIKTGSGIYPEHFAQMAGYELMLNEMGYGPIKGHIVLNLSKDGKFKEKRSVSTEDAKSFFLACVEVYRLQEKFKNQII
jgi:hypothetical protein